MDKAIGETVRYICNWESIVKPADFLRLQLATKHGIVASYHQPAWSCIADPKWYWFRVMAIQYLRHCLLKCQSKTVRCCTNALNDYDLDRLNERGKIPSRELVSFWWLKCKTITILQSLDKNPLRKINTGRYHHMQNAARHLLMISPPVIKISPYLIFRSTWIKLRDNPITRLKVSNFSW